MLTVSDPHFLTSLTTLSIIKLSIFPPSHTYDIECHLNLHFPDSSSKTCKTFNQHCWIELSGMMAMFSLSWISLHFSCVACVCVCMHTHTQSCLTLCNPMDCCPPGSSDNLNYPAYTENLLSIQSVQRSWKMWLIVKVNRQSIERYWDSSDDGIRWQFKAVKINMSKNLGNDRSKRTNRSELLVETW